MPSAFESFCDSGKPLKAEPFDANDLPGRSGTTATSCATTARKAAA